MEPTAISLFGYSLTAAQFGLLVLVFGLLVGYGLGASFSTTKLKLTKPRKKKKSDVFLRGFHAFLANDTDQAIADLTKAVELDSETIETYVALGHLYRQKGQFDRAVAIRQSIIARPDAPDHIRLQAVYDLGVDYHQAGFLSRATEALETVLREDGRHVGALERLEMVQEELKQWDKAVETRRRLDRLTGQSSNLILAHLKTAQARQEMAQGQTAKAKAALKKALNWDKNCADALLTQGDLFLASGDLKKALAAWSRIGTAAPELAVLALAKVTNRNWEGSTAGQIEEFIVNLAEESADPRARLLAARYLALNGDEDRTIAALRRIIKDASDFLPAHQDLGQLLLERGNIDSVLSAYKSLLENLPRLNWEFECRSCGQRTADFNWKCPSCRQWDALKPIRC